MSTGYPPKISDAADNIASHQGRRFLLKINAADCPGGIGTPSDQMQWENQSFLSDRPRKSKDKKPLPHAETRVPENGDHLMVWVNDKDGGSGLTATARISNVVEQGGRIGIRLSGVNLLPRPRLNRSDLNRRSPTSDVFDDIRRSTVQQLRFLADAAWDEIISEAQLKAKPDESKASSKDSVVLSENRTPERESISASAFLLAYTQANEDIQTTVRATEISPLDYLAKLSDVFAETAKFELLHAEPVSDLASAWRRLQAILSQQAEDLSLPIHAIPRGTIVAAIRRVAREFPISARK